MSVICMPTAYMTFIFAVKYWQELFQLTIISVSKQFVHLCK